MNNLRANLVDLRINLQAASETDRPVVREIYLRKSIELVEGLLKGATQNAGNQPRAEKAAECLSALPVATAYEISGVMAFLSYLEKNTKLAEFFADADLAATATSAIDNAASSKANAVRWLEGEYYSSDGIKKHLGLFCMFGGGKESLIIEYEPLKDGSFKQIPLLGSTHSWQASNGEFSESDIKQKAERACLYAWLVAYFESNPAAATITVKPGRPARVKNGKEVKRALAEIRTIVIDGVEKIFTTDGVNFRVHPRGWHVRRHNVREHERHYASGKVAIVRAFQRGDIKLGFVSHESPAAQPETRFSVQPDKVFFDTDVPKAAEKTKKAGAGQA